MRKIKEIRIAVFIYLAALAVCCAALSAQGADGAGNCYHAGNRLTVLALYGADLMEEKDFKSERMIRIGYGEEVEVLQPGDASSLTRDRWVTGRWICVRYRYFEGYLFDGYLSSLPAPDIQRKKRNQYPMAIPLSMILKDYVETHFTPQDHMANLAGNSRGNGRHEKNATRLRSLTGAAGGVDALYRAHPEDNWTELRLQGVRLMDAYHLAVALVQKSPYRRGLLKDLLFVKDKKGGIYKITGKKRSCIYIRRVGDNEVRLKMSCGV